MSTNFSDRSRQIPLRKNVIPVFVEVKSNPSNYKQEPLADSVYGDLSSVAAGQRIVPGLLIWY